MCSVFGTFSEYIIERSHLSGSRVRNLVKLVWQ